MIKVARNYRYVVEDWDRHGNVRVYLRVPGKPKVRLHEEPGTPEFDAEYRRAIESKVQMKGKGRQAVNAGSLNALCLAYYQGAAFRRLEPRTRYQRKLVLDKLCDLHGTKPAALMEPRHVRNIRDAKAETPEAANHLLRSLRAVFHAAVLSGLVSRNPARDVEYLRSGSEGYHTWTAEEVQQFEAHHPVGTKARLAMALLLLTGQRRSDVVRLGKQHLRAADWLTLTQHKNRNRKPVTLSIPVVPELRRILDASPCGDLTFLVTQRGTPYGVDSFGNAFRAWCREAGLNHCSAHGLRKAAASRLAELGASTHQIAAVTGHRSLKEVQRYTAGATQRRMAASAMALLTEQTEPEKSHPETAVGEVGRKRSLTD